MPRVDHASPRLYVEAPLSADGPVRLDRDQAHHLTTVLRLRAGDAVLVFNGRDGEWRATLSGGRGDWTVRPETCVRPQPAPSRLVYCFAPLKHARLDYMVQKAVEMGAGALQPVLTRRTQASRVNVERMRANVVEAAQQCGVLSIAEVREPLGFGPLLENWPADAAMVFCDEDAEVVDPVAALAAAPPPRDRPIGIIVGPEGGFDDAERDALMRLPTHVRVALGPRVLRADTAAVAALALVQAVLGDWR